MRLIKRSNGLDLHPHPRGSQVSVNGLHEPRGSPKGGGFDSLRPRGRGPLRVSSSSTVYGGRGAGRYVGWLGGSFALPDGSLAVWDGLAHRFGRLLGVAGGVLLVRETEWLVVVVVGAAQRCVDQADEEGLRLQRAAG